MLSKIFLKAADISNGCRSFPVYSQLVVALEEELFLQGDQEAHFGLPISPMSDRSKDSLAVSQDFWLTSMLQPLAEPFGRFLTPEMRDAMLAKVADNRVVWLRLMEKY